MCVTVPLFTSVYAVDQHTSSSYFVMVTENEFSTVIIIIMNKENVNPQTRRRPLVILDSRARPPFLELSITHPHVVMDTVENGEAMQLYNERAVGIMRDSVDGSDDMDHFTLARQFYLGRLLQVRPPLGNDGVELLMNNFHGIGHLHATLHVMRVTDTIRYPALDVMQDGEMLQYYLRRCFRFFYSHRLT